VYQAGSVPIRRATSPVMGEVVGRHQPTRDYITRRLAEGKTKNEIMRCLKRYIAREIFHTLPNKSTTELIA
jgi:transposase